MKSLLQKTFENEFKESNYKDLIINLFNRFDFSKEHSLKQQFNEAERHALNDFTYLGTFEDAEKKKLDVLTVELRSGSKVERARSLQRNLVGKFLKTNLNDAALVAFYSKDNPDWRLSFVKMEYKITDKGVKVDIGTPPKRYSFLIGKTEPSHTAQKQLIDFLDADITPTVEDLEKAFSIEKVTKEFYTQVALMFTELVGGERKVGTKKITEKGSMKIPSTNDATVKKEFAVRLIGRLLFCWFLKKKKSEEGESLIPSSILSYNAITMYPNYYHSLLEPLFFQVLNTPIDNRNKRVRHDFWNKIPFLNGGLFEPHQNDFYDIDALGTSKYLNTLKVPDNWVRQLFEIFEMYNFTIDESTSIDVEISIDPEMLGRIFENLLAEINPETGETARKATGSYYTPRPIVEYMVDESLKRYLDTKTGIGEDKLSKLLSYAEDDAGITEQEKDLLIDALDNLKIIDPACGSGAFPMGILHKMLLILQKIDPKSSKWLLKKLSHIENKVIRNEIERKLKRENWDYIHKLGIIQNSIYGVDIQPIAAEISKLRFFLSLIVDEMIDDTKTNRGIEPLPNLEFKFVSANSLISLPKAESGLAESHRDIERLRKLREEYFTSYGDGKRRIEEDFQKIQKNMLLHSLNWQTTKSQTYKLSEWNPFLDEPSAWFDPEWMFGVVQGFDIVIANPPYLKERDNKKIFEIINKSAFGKKYHQGKMDYWFYFLHKAIDIVKMDGVISYITSRYWLNSQGSKGLIKRISDELSFVSFVDIGKLKVFDNVAGHHMVAVYVKNKNVNTFIYKRLENNIADINNNHTTENQSIKMLENSKVISNSNEIIIENSNKMMVNVIPLGDICETSIGIQESVDKISRKQLEKSKRVDLAIGTGVFVLSENELQKLHLSYKEKQTVKKYLDPNDVLKYCIKPANKKYVIYSDKRIREKIEKDLDYRNLKKHFDNLKEFITSSNAPYGLHRSRELKYFENPKIIFKGMFVENEFAYDEDKYFIGFSFSLIIQKDNKYNLKYILSILNSKFALRCFTIMGNSGVLGLI